MFLLEVFIFINLLTNLAISFLVYLVHYKTKLLSKMIEVDMYIIDST